jgi:crotonobetainyl-CoA:carnitine CoA-transferase CaiB-like acyl-CoA transferase
MATRTREPHALQEQLRAAGVPATEVLDGYGLRADETMTRRGFFAEVNPAEGGRRDIPGRQAIFSYLPKTLPRRAPTLGVHTNAVLSEVLGMDVSTIGRLRDEGVLA